MTVMGSVMDGFALSNAMDEGTVAEGVFDRPDFSDDSPGVR